MRPGESTSGGVARALPGLVVRSRGFTLIELLVTIAIAAILLALAAPSFGNVSLASKLGADANRISASAILSRAEAIKRNSAIVMCASSTGTSCATTGDWEQGWIVFNDSVTRNSEVDVGEEILHREVAAPPGFRIMETTPQLALSFSPTGVGTTQGTFIVCRATPTVGSQERKVTVNATGRTAVTKPSPAVGC